MQILIRCKRRPPRPLGSSCPQWAALSQSTTIKKTKHQCLNSAAHQPKPNNSTTHRLLRTPRSSAHTLWPHSEADAVVAGYPWVKRRQGDVALLKLEGTLAPPSLPDSPQLRSHCQRLPGWHLQTEKVQASSQSPAILLEGSQGQLKGDKLAHQLVHEGVQPPEA